VLPNSRWHLSVDEYPELCHGTVVSDVPLKARYTRVENSSSFNTSDGLHPKDMLVVLRRAEAQH
jgi:hypothetical protein